MSLLPAVNPDLVDTGTPPIPAARAWLAEYSGKFGRAINMSQAAPGSPPPAQMLERLQSAAAGSDATAYGRILGDHELVEAYAAHCSSTYGAEIAPTEIAITAGCNLAYVATIMAVARAGDSVLLPEPWYFNHEMTLRMLGLRPVPLPCRPEDGFVPDVGAALRLVDARTRAVVLVSPNNPTGAIYPPAVIRAFAEMAAERRLWLILDETYRDFLSDGEARPHDLFADAVLRRNIIQLYSFSKSYCIPGYRVGAMLAPASMMAEIAKVLDCLQICAPRAGQIALAWAIDALASWREECRGEILARASAFRSALAGSNGWSISSIGAYFSYVRHPYPSRTAEEVARHLATDLGVLALPGTFFGSASQAGHIRFAFANSDAPEIARIAERLDALAL